MEDRRSLFRGRTFTDQSALQLASELLGPSIATSKVGWAAYLYQVCKLGSPMNAGLRAGALPGLLSKMAAELASQLGGASPLGRTVTVFRGVDHLKGVKVGDVIRDGAFNSVSLDPTVAEFFGRQVLAIKLRPEDRLLYLNGPDFFPDTFECLLGPGTAYRVLSVSSHGRVDLYEMETLPAPLTHWSTDVEFDQKYHMAFSSVSMELEGRRDKPASEWCVLRYETGSDRWSDASPFLGIDYPKQVGRPLLSREEEFLLDSSQLYVRCLEGLTVWKVSSQEQLWPI